MLSFAERLKEEIDYMGFTRKELSFKAGIKPRALDMYLGTQASMPPADVAVRIAKALGVSVEYLVTGEKAVAERTIRNYIKMEKDMDSLSDSVAESISEMIHTIAQREQELRT